MLTSFLLPSLMAVSTPLPAVMVQSFLPQATATARKRRPIVVVICIVTRGKAKICQR